MESGAFRRDLYARIAGFIHEAPPLRERREDTGLLVAALLGATDSESAIHLRPEVGEAFFRYGWPLNVRELEQCLASGQLLTEDGILRLSHLPESIVMAWNRPRLLPPAFTQAASPRAC